MSTRTDKEFARVMVRAQEYLDAKKYKRAVDLLMHFAQIKEDIETVGAAMLYKFYALVAKALWLNKETNRLCSLWERVGTSIYCKTIFNKDTEILNAIYEYHMTSYPVLVDSKMKGLALYEASVVCALQGNFQGTCDISKLLIGLNCHENAFKCFARYTTAQSLHLAEAVYICSRLVELEQQCNIQKHLDVAYQVVFNLFKAYSEFRVIPKFRLWLIEACKRTKNFAVLTAIKDEEDDQVRPLLYKVAKDIKAWKRCLNDGERPLTRVRMCAACGQFAYKMKKCSECMLFYYCNEECNKIGWNDHKPWCQRIKSVRKT